MVTYIFCGIVFSTLFNYQELFALENVRYFMRGYDSVSIQIGPLAQGVRGILFGIVILLIKDSLEGRYGWLKLWGIIAIIGIINTPGPAPSSIEGLIYTQLPLEYHLKGAPEILVQTLLFSYLVAKPRRTKQRSKFLEANKIPLTATVLTGMGFSIFGIVLALMLKVDLMAGASDMGAFFVMFVAMAMVFFITKWYSDTDIEHKKIILALVYYIAMAVMPTTYNFLTDSPFKSILSLIVNIVPTLITSLFVYYSIPEDPKTRQRSDRLDHC
jgi:MFS family permease